MRNFILGLLLALAVSSSSMETHQDGSVTLLPAEALVFDARMRQMQSDLAKALLIINDQQKRLDENKGVCI
jgi:hypothetical protein